MNNRIENIEIKRANVIGESKTSLLIALSRNLSIWISKKMCFKNEFKLTLNVGISKSFEYHVLENGIKKPISFENLKSYLENL